jgi:hypothetical protein
MEMSGHSSRQGATRALVPLALVAFVVTARPEQRLYRNRSRGIVPRELGLLIGAVLEREA